MQHTKYMICMELVAQINTESRVFTGTTMCISTSDNHKDMNSVNNQILLI